MTHPEPEVGRLVDRRSTGHHGADVNVLLDEADALHERLHRVILALTMAEDRAAVALDRLADTGGPMADQHRKAARRARSSAGLCRELGQKLRRLRA